MKLITARINNFRSIEDTTEFRIDGTTCLVGKNEAGKSAVLQALGALNPHPSTPLPLEALRDYPRRYWNLYRERHPEDDAVVVTTTWQLESEERAALEGSYGSGALHDKPITILRRYEAKEAEWQIELNISAVIFHIATGCSSAEISALEIAVDLPQAHAILSALTERTPEADALTKRLTGTKSLSESVRAILVPFLPSFMYVASYDRMPGEVQIDDLNTLVTNGQITLDQNCGKKLFHEFFAFARVPLADILKETKYEAFDWKLEAASNAITDQMLDYWTQNQDVEVRVRIEQARTADPTPFNSGYVARARIFNRLHRATTPFSERSAGFIWFFSFLVKFDQVKRSGERVILLLDEPGLTLHGKAQGQLLRYFEEKLAPKYQVVYSTHSPFMVAPDKLHNARVVEDTVVVKGTRREPLGTKVTEDILLLDPDSIFPLQGALGYEVTQTLFVGKHTLLVEGPSDILYVQALSQELRRRSRVGLDPRWTMCPAGGIDKISAFVSLFGGKGLHVAVLTDLAAGDKGKVERLRKSEILKVGHVYSAAEFTGKSESDIEDLFDVSIYAALLNASHAVPPDKALTPQKLAAAETTTPAFLSRRNQLSASSASSVTIRQHIG